ncbi:hypothetical protein [Oligoflexus tunisiensis]|uniref:hypothetical protein n=1 Tax=Oligoflexus tunisiensis TaxID=708132 RepID=UPI00114CD6D8|nr:hypothetical protein [Oligoflexus tunisiensis]
MPGTIKIILTVILGGCIGTWMAMSYCAVTRLRMSGLGGLKLALEVMVQFPWLCIRVFNHDPGTHISISTLKASDMSYLAVYPLDRGRHSQIYIGRNVWEARSAIAIADLLSKVQSHAPELPRDCYGISHLKTGQAVSWIYRDGKFTVSHAYDYESAQIDNQSDQTA